MKQVANKKLIEDAPVRSSFFQQESRDPFFGGNDNSFGNTIQAKTTTNQPGDPFEQDADTMADKVVKQLSVPVAGNGITNKSTGLSIQRKCKECEEEEDNKIQRKEEGGADQFSANSLQPATGTTPETAPAPTTTPQPVESGRFIVNDNAVPGEGQIRKSDFLAQLKEGVCAAVNSRLAGTPFSSDNCPYIQAAFARHAGSSPAQIEQLLQRYAPATAMAKSATELIELVKAKAADAAMEWVQSKGDLSSFTDTIGDVAGNIGKNIGAAASGIGNMFFKAGDGGATPVQSPASVMQSLGQGATLDSHSRSNMEPVFGTSFSDVQVHTGGHAADLSDNMNALAFTVGNHIVFGNNQHKPGTVAGDALIAHELTHVLQQRGVGGYTTDQYQELEQEADQAAGTVLSSQYNIKQGNKKIQTKSRGGLKIQRCAGPKANTKPTVTPKPAPQQPSQPPLSNPANLPVIHEVLGEAGCDVDQGKITWRIANSPNIPICMYDCIAAHEEAHVRYGQQACAKVSGSYAKLKVAEAKMDEALKKAQQSKSEADLSAAEKAAAELEAATKDFDAAVKEYEKWHEANCKANEKQAYQAGIDKCKEKAIVDSCTETKESAKYGKLMGEWEQFKNAPPNCK